MTITAKCHDGHNYRSLAPASWVHNLAVEKGTNIEALRTPSRRERKQGRGNKAGLVRRGSGCVWTPPVQLGVRARSHRSCRRSKRGVLSSFQEQRRFRARASTPRVRRVSRRSRGRALRRGRVIRACPGGSATLHRLRYGESRRCPISHSDGRLLPW